MTGLPNRAPHDLPLTPSLRKSITEGWEAQPEVQHPAAAGAAQAAGRHRARLSARFTGASLVVASGRPTIRNNDVAHPFRPASPYVWLTGDQTPGGVLVMRADRPTHAATLYMAGHVPPGTADYLTDRARSPLWVGAVPSSAATAAALDIEIRPGSELHDALASLRGTSVRVIASGEPAVAAVGPTDLGPAGDLAQTLDRLRRNLDEWEQGQMAEAADVTVVGFGDVVREIPGVLAAGGHRAERWLEGTFWRRSRLAGNGPAYNSIVAAGDHATSLHWTSTDGDLRAGQLLLADMGAENRSCYAADVTRTLPVDIAWTPDQLKVYRAVAEARNAAIAECKAGHDFLAGHWAAQRVLAEALHRWGILDVPPEVALDPDPERPGAGAQRRYTLHSVSHSLGLDVHDCAQIPSTDYLAATLEPGNALTVEPGLYFQRNDLTVPPELRGLAVRIEDDILVTSGTPRVLSEDLPVEPEEVIEWMSTVAAGPVAGQ